MPANHTYIGQDQSRLHMYTNACGCCGKKQIIPRSGDVIRKCKCHERDRCGMCGRCADHCKCGG